ncbi:MAG: Phage tail fiber protein / Phage host specificity protein [Achromobacter mucicolens]|jgi:hypothetical protein|uniref:hypothetical protein n=1 Tax=Achromobacter mucicolens TaxID=1389922 RepID=UPI00242DCF7C|nr:hypothetical protein [Achromobacter mucicolens]MDF2861342.1 Phage tail fiber protein / Phage host specificity protein [Achromobacter mucicolens]
MATSQRSGLRYADLPAIEAAQLPGNPAATRALEQMRMTLATRFGKGGQAVDRAVTWGDLVENGIVSMRGADGKPILIQNPGGAFQPSTPPVVDGIPPAPTGFTVTPALGSVVLEWDKPNFAYFGYAEIFRGTTNNQAQALSVGQTTGWVYADPVGGDATVTYFYWVRFVSVGGKVGPFNAVGGTAGAVSLDPAYLIDVLAAEGDPNALLYEIKEPTVINGVPVPPGIYVKSLYVANGSISTLQLGNAAITDAKVASLSAAKVTFGEMSGDRIAVNSLNADRLTVASLSARLAVITDAYVKTANIQDAAITNAKIADLSAEKITAGVLNAARIGASSITADKLNVAALSAITANIGLLRTAVSGQRTEFDANGVRVYHPNGVLAVRLGIW